MPIHRMYLEADVFVAKTVGYLDNLDAKMWANALRNHADTSVHPLNAVVDMVEVSRLCPTVIKILSELIKTQSTDKIGIVISESMASQNARVIDKLGEINGIRIFATYEDAYRFVQFSGAPATAACGAGNFSMFNFSTVGTLN